MAHVRIFKHYVHIPYLLLGMTEGIVFMLSIYMGAYVRFFHNLEELDLLGPLLYYGSMTGVWGLSVQLALFQDIFSTLTIHIYCFYVYAAR